MNKTKIEWCDMTWNPVTGCLHNCEYCYARKIAQRFGGDLSFTSIFKSYEIYDLNEKVWQFSRGKIAVYPYKFAPTFHRYHLNEPQKHKKPQNVFVCSMADLFGDWIPDEWIQAVFKACEAAPQHGQGYP